jgi:hypothetical protein
MFILRAGTNTIRPAWAHLVHRLLLHWPERGARVERTPSGVRIHRNYGAARILCGTAPALMHTFKQTFIPQANTKRLSR